MPDGVRSNPLREGACIPAVNFTQDHDPFMAGFYWAAETAYGFLFWPVLDELLWEGATWQPDDGST